MTDNKKAIILDDSLAPVPVNVTINHVDSQSTLNDHVDSDAIIMTANLGLLMQTWPRLQSLDEICKLSDQVMKTLTKRRELCLKPTSKGDVGDDEIDITPVK